MTSVSDLDCQSTRFVEKLLADFSRDPVSVPPAWRRYFEQLSSAASNGDAVQMGPSFSTFSVYNPPPAVSQRAGQGAGRGAGQSQRPTPAATQARVDQLVHAYRVRGHLAAKLDPLGLQRESPAELHLETYGLVPSDLDETCASIAVGGPDSQSLGSLIERMQSTYCRFIGVQFMHIDDPDVRDWLSHRMEESQNRLILSRNEQLRILTRLTDAVTFERFVRKKYVGAKTFSLEGAETLIPLLDLAIGKAARAGITRIVIGMAHRGRLNVLANIIGKSPQEIFWEFEDPNAERHRGRGDVKYHLGYSGDFQTADGHEVHLSLCFNPSHLEFVNPVALGRTRAKQERERRGDRRCMTLLIHGDAGFAGEGIVQETLNLSELSGYRTGGTLHVIVNNQIGFTTVPAEGRSTTYASSIAKMLQVPLFHVNGERPEAVAQAVDLAMDFRATYGRDVVIDMYCYRRWGHNESDEPSFTQPLMYRAIEHRESIRDSYLNHLLTLDGITREEADEIARERHEDLGVEFERARDGKFEPPEQSLTGIWSEFLGGPEPNDDEVDSGVAADQLSQILLKLTQTPDEFHLHRKLRRSVERRRQMAEGERPIDWSTAEALALATLALEGHPIRLCGQDTVRGTFSQRHAILYDTVDGHEYCPLRNLSVDQARVEFINSPLCEAAALAFEYGYSLDYPEALVGWEAQFGDFWNAAQVVVDQFVASAEDKWQRLSGLVMLLPHGFEGQGPEHSSARLERLLTLAAEDNLQVVCPSTPAQYFHCLRRQVKRRWRKPLIVLTPKSLLRHRKVVSSLEELSERRFHRILPDHRAQQGSSIERILLCTGKVYYELAQVRDQHDRHDVAIIRIEQLYPLRDECLQAVLEPYDSRTPLYWVQEEPQNMGAYAYWRVRFGDRWLGHPFKTVTRPASASPATGSHAAHEEEQQDLIRRAFENA